MFKELVAVWDDRNERWEDAFNVSNTIHLNIKSGKDAVNFVRNTYKEFRDCKFEIDDCEIWALMPEDQLINEPINPGTKPK